MNRLKYVVITLIAVIFTWTLHEFAHWMTGEWLGNDMTMTLNTCYATDGHYIENWHSTIVSAVGPMTTLAQAIIFYYLLKIKSNRSLFPFLLTCLYMRLLAGIMNFINPNDEGRISVELGLGTYTLSILIVGILFYLVYDTSKKGGFEAKSIAVTVLWIMLFSSVLILVDQALKIIILT